MLGLVAQNKRQISSGAEYDKYFSRASMTDVIIKQSGNVFDTLNEMERIVRETLNDTKAISTILRKGTLKDTCQNIFDFVYKHINYKLDEYGIEQLRRPVRTWSDRKTGVDCDCYSIFISSILTNLGINHSFRMIKLDGKSDYQHVYVVVPKGIGNDNYILDPVLDSFNTETHRLTSKYDKEMKIAQLNGIDEVITESSTVQDIINGLTGGHTTNNKSQLKGVKLTSFNKNYLSQLGSEAEPFENYLDGLSGLNGLGSITSIDSKELEKQYWDAIKRILINTRNSVAINPEMSGPYRPLEYIRLIDYVLYNFDNSVDRERAFSIVIQQEKNALKANSNLRGLGDLGKTFFGKLWQGAKDGWAKIKGVAQNAIDFAKNAVKKAGDILKKAAAIAGQILNKFIQLVKDIAKKVLRFIMRFNPVTALVRFGILVLFRINFLRCSSRLMPGYLTEDEAVGIGIGKLRWEKTKKALEKVESFWYGFGGKVSNLRKAIYTGKRASKLNEKIKEYSTTLAGFFDFNEDQMDDINEDNIPEDFIKECSKYGNIEDNIVEVQDENGNTVVSYPEGLYMFDWVGGQKVTIDGKNYAGIHCFTGYHGVEIGDIVYITVNDGDQRYQGYHRVIGIGDDNGGENTPYGESVFIIDIEKNLPSPQQTASGFYQIIKRPEMGTFDWVAGIEGPKGTPYEGKNWTGIHLVNWNEGVEYPFFLVGERIKITVTNGNKTYEGISTIIGYGLDFKGTADKSYNYSLPIINWPKTIANPEGNAQGSWELVQEGLGEAASAVAGAASGIGAFLSSIWTWIKNLPWKDILQAVGKVGDLVKGLFNKKDAELPDVLNNGYAGEETLDTTSSNASTASMGSNLLMFGLLAGGVLWAVNSEDDKKQGPKQVKKENLSGVKRKIGEYAI